MTRLPDIRRHHDGSIDFDFYRRRAFRRRRAARWLAVRRGLNAVCGTLKAVATLGRRAQATPEGHAPAALRP